MITGQSVLLYIVVEKFFLDVLATFTVTAHKTLIACSMSLIRTNKK